MFRRAVLHPDDIGQWPDVSTASGSEATCREWLELVLAMPTFAVALEHATPALASRARAVIAGVVGGRDAGRVVLAVMRYALRATSRATPFGWFAGVALTSLSDRTYVRHGNQHQASVRMPADWIDMQVAGLEADPSLQPLLTVMASNLVVETGSHLVLNNRAGSGKNAKPVHVQIRTTPAVRAALALARAPLPAAALASKVAAETGIPATSAAKVLARLIEQQFLLSALRPPMTAPDPLGYLVTELARVAGLATTARAGAEGLQEPLANLGTVRSMGSRFDVLQQVARIPRGPQAWDLAQRNLGEMSQHLTDLESRPAVDVRLDCTVTVPGIVAEEAANAAALLTRIAAPARSGWSAWHGQFLDRYGPHALVPVLDVVDADRGLGLPAGFHGGPPALAPSFNGRDQWLLAAAQHAALTGQQEITLDDAAIAALAVEKPLQQPTTEATIRLSARTAADIDRGNFTIELLGMSSWAGRTIGRFLSLFADSDQRRIAAAYPADRGPLAVQVSAPGPYAVTADLARAPQVLPHLLPVGEYHDDQPGMIRLEDVAVTADAERVYLIWVPERRPILPVAMNAVESFRFTLPIVRFLTEAPVALDPQCTAFDWGAAGSLPYLPAVRFGRAILSPAMWLLKAGTLLLPTDAEPAGFNAALAAWQAAVKCPNAVFLGDGDQLIRVDLTHPGHQALLRDHLARKGQARLRAEPSTDANEWIGGYAHEFVVPLTAVDPIPVPKLRTTAVVNVRDHGILPADSGHTFLKIYCRPETQSVILTAHLPHLIASLGPGATCWFQRYADQRPHLRLRLIGTSNPHAVNTWLHRLQDAGLTGDVQSCTDFPETGRYGGIDALAAAERFFSADSAAAIHQLTAAGHRPGPPAQALTAASLLDIASAAFGDASTGMRWLINNTRAHRPAPTRQIYKATIAAADPHRGLLSALPNGPDLLAAWRSRAAALAEYQAELAAAGIDSAQLLPDLLHLHHARIAGPDIDGERVCLHLARAAALSWSARTRRRP